MYRHVWVLSALLCCLVGCSTAQTRGQAADEADKEDPEIKNVQTIGDVTEVGNVSPRPVSGVSLVCGLNGTGGGMPPGEFRDMLEKQLLVDGVQNVKELLASPNYAVVLVSVVIPIGARIGDPLDIEVSLPAHSTTTSLRGGYLRKCPLYEFDVKHFAQGNDKLTKGHILASAQDGPLLVGFEEGKEESRVRLGRIWSGAVSHVDSPLCLYLKNDQRYVKVAAAVANKINVAFPDDAQKQHHLLQTRRLMVLEQVTSSINDKSRGSNTLNRGECAHAVDKGMVDVNVPLEYRLNPERYLHVIRLIPLHENADTASRYRAKLNEMLLDPKDTIRAALRLEALGKESTNALKKGLTSQEALVRFAAAEALTYLGSTAGIEELARLAEKHETLRSHCLTAMAGLNESCSQLRLAELMKSPKPPVRIGAFRALLALNDGDLSNSRNFDIRGELLNDAFWLHHVAPQSAAMVHVSTNKRAEIVIFGESPSLVSPVKLVVGGEFIITAEPSDQKCTVSRFVVQPANVVHKQCSFKLDDVLQTIAVLGGQYNDAVEFLKVAQSNKCLTCAVAIDSLPVETPLDLLAASGSDANRLKTMNCFQEEIAAIQQDLGMVPTQPTTATVTARPQR